jgi:uncharacterized membrane protein
MNKINILYWTFTGIFAAFMIFSSISNVLLQQPAVDLIHTQLGYPLYFISFIGIAKIVGAIVLLIPGLNRIKEWAYYAAPNFILCIVLLLSSQAFSG